MPFDRGEYQRQKQLAESFGRSVNEAFGVAPNQSEIDALISQAEALLDKAHELMGESQTDDTFGGGR